MKLGRLFYTADRRAWRRWLKKRHATAKEVWLVQALSENSRESRLACFPRMTAANKRFGMVK